MKRTLALLVVALLVIPTPVAGDAENVGVEIEVDQSTIDYDESTDYHVYLVKSDGTRQEITGADNITISSSNSAVVVDQNTSTLTAKSTNSQATITATVDGKYGYETVETVAKTDQSVSVDWPNTHYNNSFTFYGNTTNTDGNFTEYFSSGLPSGATTDNVTVENGRLVLQLETEKTEKTFHTSSFSEYDPDNIVSTGSNSIDISGSVGYYGSVTEGYAYIQKPYNGSEVTINFTYDAATSGTAQGEVGLFNESGDTETLPVGIGHTPDGSIFATNTTGTVAELNPNSQPDSYSITYNFTAQTATVIQYNTSDFQVDKGSITFPFQKSKADLSYTGFRTEIASSSSYDGTLSNFTYADRSYRDTGTYTKTYDVTHNATDIGVTNDAGSYADKSVTVQNGDVRVQYSLNSTSHYVDQYYVGWSGERYVENPGVVVDNPATTAPDIQVTYDGILKDGETATVATSNITGDFDLVPTEDYNYPIGYSGPETVGNTVWSYSGKHLEAQNGTESGDTQVQTGSADVTGIQLNVSETQLRHNSSVTYSLYAVYENDTLMKVTPDTVAVSDGSVLGVDKQNATLTSYAKSGTVFVNVTATVNGTTYQASKQVSVYTITLSDSEFLTGPQFLIAFLKNMPFLIFLTCISLGAGATKLTMSCEVGYMTTIVGLVFFWGIGWAPMYLPVTTTLGALALIYYTDRDIDSTEQFSDTF